MKVAIMGTGGLGSYFGGRMAYRGQDVTFISRGKQLEALQTSGLKIDSPDGSIHLSNLNVTNDCAAVGQVDLVIFCVKSYDTAEAAEQMRPMVGPDTVILPVQNGIAHVDTLKDILGEQHVLGGMTILGAYMQEPGHVRRFTPDATIFFGELNNSISRRCRKIGDQLQKCGVDGQPVDNIVYDMWRKMAAMSALFGVFSLARADAGTVRNHPELKEMVIQTAAEAIGVARANRIDLPDDLLKEIGNSLQILPSDWRPSMGLALQQGKRLELEQVNGVICEFGRKVDQPTPLNDMIYAALKPFAAGKLSPSPTG